MMSIFYLYYSKVFDDVTVFLSSLGCYGQKEKWMDDQVLSVPPNSL